MEGLESRVQGLGLRWVDYLWRYTEHVVKYLACLKALQTLTQPIFNACCSLHTRIPCFKTILCKRIVSNTNLILGRAVSQAAYDKQHRVARDKSLCTIPQL